MPMYAEKWLLSNSVFCSIKAIVVLFFVSFFLVTASRNKCYQKNQPETTVV